MWPRSKLTNGQRTDPDEGACGRSVAARALKRGGHLQVATFGQVKGTCEVHSKKGPVVRSTVVRPSPAEIAFSVATVDVGAMIDSQDCDGYCLIVDLVDHSVRSPTSCP